MTPAEALPLRVLVAHPSDDLYGADRMAALTAESFAAAGAVVTLAAPGTHQLGKLLDNTGVRLRVIDTPILQKKRMSFSGILTLALQSAVSLPGLCRLISRERPDVVYVNTLTQPLWILASFLMRTPTICHVHELEATVPQVVQSLITCPLYLCKTIICNSRSTSDFIAERQRHLKGRLQVVYNGNNWPEPVAPRGHEGLNLVLVGRLSPRKGQRVAIDAVANLVARGVDCRLRLVGDVYAGYEWYRRELEDQVPAKGLEGRVELIGFADDPYQHYAWADIVLVPSLQEPFGLVAVEAMAAGRPVVASRVEGLREIIDDRVTGFLFYTGDCAALADTVLMVDSDSELTEQVVKSARSSAEERFGLKQYRRETWRQVLAAAGRPAPAS